MANTTQIDAKAIQAKVARFNRDMGGCHEKVGSGVVIDLAPGTKFDGRLVTFPNGMQARINEHGVLDFTPETWETIPFE